MTINSISRDLRFPFAGETVTITATFDEGTRVRCRLLSAPPGSALPIWDAGAENWLPNNQITPDVGGVYDVQLVEESETNIPPRFSNDLGDASPAHAGSAAGTIEITPWSTATCSVVVGDSLQRRIGIEPDDVVMRLCTHADWNYQTAPTTWGVVTRFADASRCPVLDTTASSDAAKSAAMAATVAQAVQDMGGWGDDYHRYGDAAYGETSLIIDWDEIGSSNILLDLVHLIAQINEHIVIEYPLAVHAAVDNTNTVVSPDAAAGNAASQVTLLNDLRDAIVGHAAKTVGDPGGVLHGGADPFVAADMAGVADLAGGATLADRIARTNLLWRVFDGHIGRTYGAAGLAGIHYAPGENRLDSVTYPKATSEATAVARMNNMKLRYGTHRSLQNADTGIDYHAITGDAHSQYVIAYPSDRDSYVSAVQELWSVFRDHVGNRMHDSGAPTSFHASVDTTLTTLLAGQPTDFESAVRYHEVLVWAFGQHVSRTGNVHASVYPGGYLTTRYGVAGVSDAFRSALTASTGTTNVRENVATTKLILLNGFTKKG